MRKTEQRLWDRMRHAIKDQLYYERIENMVGTGRPDIDIGHAGIFFPVELKAVAAYPARPTTPVLGARGLSQKQKNWWLRWRSFGGEGFILVGVELDLFCVLAQHSEVLNSFTKTELEKFATSWPEFIHTVKREAQCIRGL